MAIEYEKRDRCRTYIYVDESIPKVKGFFSIGLKTLQISDGIILSKTLSRKLGNASDEHQHIPAFLIGQLGRDSSYDSAEIDGKDMLQDCYDLILAVREIVGGRVVLLDCRNEEKLCRYYEGEGFIDITEAEGEMRRYVRLLK